MVCDMLICLIEAHRYRHKCVYARHLSNEEMHETVGSLETPRSICHDDRCWQHGITNTCLPFQ